MSEELKIGDMAFVYKWPCCERYVGRVVTLTAAAQVHPPIICDYCKKLFANSTYNVFVDESTGRWPREYLKKIHPLPEKDKTEFLESLKDEVRV